MAITNMTLPNLITSINPGNFGALEKRTSNYGAINTLYKNAKALFGEEVIAQIRKQPLGRAIQIPIFENYSHTVLTTRSCSINCQDISTRLKTLTRTHLAIDICINPDDYTNNYVAMQQALRHRYMQAKKAVYLTLDTMGATFIDANKDTSFTADPNGGPYANPLFIAKAGVRQLPTSLKFYSYLQTIMEQLDIQGPYFDLTNTIAMAERNVLSAPGGGALLATDDLMAAAQIAEFEHSNRLASGVATPVHYIAPLGSVGALNMIDLVYQDKPVIGSLEDAEQWKRFENGQVTEIKLWAQTPDEVFNDWDWGVLQDISCVNEQILYSVKLSADFTFACDFSSTTGESPIKRFDIAALAA